VLPPPPACFEREQGLTEADWLACLPGAAAPHAVQWAGPGAARVTLGEGCLHLRWQVLPERRIALISLPRLAVRYDFEGEDEATRHAFMRRFTLFLQRGGG
jgi:hypothetical protein